MQRITWIDVARGIGIILVIHGHSLSAGSYRHLIYSFHMPLFFFISGLVFNYAHNNNFEKVFKKSIRGILIPYVLFALITYFIWLVQNNAFSNFDFQAFIKHLGGIIYGNSSTLFFNTVLWFLPVLFIAKVAFSFIANLLKSEKIIASALLGFSVLGYLVSAFFPDVKLPFGSETATTAIVFFGAGSLLVTNSHPRLNQFVSYNKLVLLAITVVFSVVFAVINYKGDGQQIDLRLLHYGNYFYFYVSSFAGIIATLILSRIITKNRVLEYIGKYSLVLFVMHPFVLLYLNQLIVTLLGKNFLYAWKEYYLSLLFTMITIGIILSFNYFIKKIKILNFFKN